MYQRRPVSEPRPRACRRSAGQVLRLRTGERPAARSHAGWAKRPGRQNTGRRPGISARPRPAALRRVLPRPQPLAPGSPAGARATYQTRNGSLRLGSPGGRPSPPAGSLTRRYLRPASSKTPRWPRTGGAPGPAIAVRTQAGPDVRTYVSPLGARHLQIGTPIAEYGRLILLTHVIIKGMTYCDLCEMDREFCEHGLADRLCSLKY